jgi:hypothetical protein
MEKYFENPSIEILESLYGAVNSMDLSRMPKFTWHERQILRASDNKTMFEEMFIDEQPNPTTEDTASIIEENESSRLRRGTYIDLASGHVREKIPVLSKDRHFFETKIEYDGIKLPIKIPLTVNAEEVGDVSSSLYVYQTTGSSKSIQVLGYQIDQHIYTQCQLSWFTKSTSSTSR